MTPRRGFTMVEMLISLSAGGALMLLAIGQVHRTMRTESAARADEHVARAAVRLSRQFRRDVHLATTLALAPQSVELAVAAPAGELATAYAFADGVVTRTQILLNGQVHREQFDFNGDCTAVFKQLNEPRRLQLTVTREHKAIRDVDQIILMLESVVGRFAGAEGFREEFEH